MAQIANKISKIRPSTIIIYSSKIIVRNDLFKHNFSCHYLSNNLNQSTVVKQKQDQQKSDELAAAATTSGIGTLNLSESCLKRLKEICTDDITFLRVAVEGGGCSGFTYKFDLDNKLYDDDIIIGNENNNDGKIVIDKTSLEYCSGATVDYHIEIIRAGFRIINNPKAEAGCSCGSSFALRLD